MTYELIGESDASRVQQRPIMTTPITEEIARKVLDVVDAGLVVGVGQPTGDKKLRAATQKAALAAVRAAQPALAAVRAAQPALAAVRAEQRAFFNLLVNEAFEVVGVIQ
jgi:hypothetical protein